MGLSSQREYVSAEAAEYAGISLATLDHWLKQGMVAGVGGTEIASAELRFTLDDLKALRTYAIALEIAEIIDEPEQWLDTPNPWMGGHSPRELIGTDREQLVIDVIEGIKHGMVA